MKSSNLNNGNTKELIIKNEKEGNLKSKKAKLQKQKTKGKLKVKSEERKGKLKEKNEEIKKKDKNKLKTESKELEEKKKNKIKSLFSPKKLVLWLAILVLIFTLPRINKDAMSKTEAIVTMMFVDKNESDNFSIALSVLAPGQERNKNLEIYLGEGNSLSEAVDSVALAVGKEIGFAQCQIMGLGSKISEQGVMQALDYMTRTKKVGRNAVLINFEGDVQEFAQAAKDINTNKNLSLDEIINFDKRYLLSEDSNIESFYIGYFSDLGLGIMPRMSLIKEAKLNAIEISNGSTSSSGSSPGMAQESSQQNSEKTYLLNDGTTVVFIDGISKYTLTPDIVEKVNTFVNNHQKHAIKIENITDEIYKDATVVLDVVKKESKINTKFDGDTPVYSVDVTLTVSAEEVAEKQLTKSLLRRNQDFLTPTLIERIKEKTKADMEWLIDYCKVNKVDLIGAYKHFYRFNYKKWQNYLKTKAEDEFLDDIKFEIKVDVKSEF